MAWYTERRDVEWHNVEWLYAEWHDVGWSCIKWHDVYRKKWRVYKHVDTCTGLFVSRCQNSTRVGSNRAATRGFYEIRRVRIESSICKYVTFCWSGQIRFSSAVGLGRIVSNYFLLTKDLVRFFYGSGQVWNNNIVWSVYVLEI